MIYSQPIKELLPSGSTGHHVGYSVFCNINQTFILRLFTLKTASYFRLTALLLCVCIAPARSQDLESIRDAKPLEIKGSLSASAIYFNMNGRDSYRKPFTWLLRGTPTLYIYGIAVPVTIVVSEQERDFRQPFNRFGISPEYKWIRLRLGYQNMQYSDYTLAGHSIVGAGVELNPGKLRFGYMYGQLLRSVQASPIIDDQDFRVIPAFKRIGNIVKFGYGTEDNYVDLILLKGSDVASSLDSIPENLTPAENLVIAITTHQRFLNHWIFDFEYARSYYTEDTRAGESTYENDYFVPSFLFNDLTSSSLSTAVKGSLNYNGDLLFGGVNYQRVDPGYRSMGAYFFLNDIQKITMDPGIKIFDGNWRIQTSFGFQENNLGNTKNYKTIRRIGGLNISGGIGNVYRFSGNYSNFGVEQREGLEVVDPALQIAQVTNQWSMSHTLTFQGESVMHSVNAMVNNQNLNDRNEMTEQFSDYTSSTFSGMYMFSLMEANLSTNVGFTHTSFSLTDQEIRYYGPNVSVNKGFFENKLRIALSANYFINNMNDEITRVISRLMLRSSYRVTRKQKVTLRAQYRNSDNRDDPDRSFNETKIEISYGLRF